jgi:hypothetical protein
MSKTSYKIKRSLEFLPQATAPVNPAEGETYFDSVSGKLLQYKGGLWKPLGGGLHTVETTYASPPPNPMASGSHYLIDMTSASGDLTVNMPAGAAGDVIRVSVWGQSTSGKYVTVIPNGAEIIWYNETSNASKIIGQTSNWMEFIFDVGKGWITNDSSSGSGFDWTNYIVNSFVKDLSTIGQSFLNINKLTDSLVQNAWSTTGNLNTARYTLAGSGTQNAALSFGGNAGSFLAVTEKWNLAQTFVQPIIEIIEIIL